ncbi:MAG: winged helix-turn-helix transcriptional regulator [Acidobacteria bacterium]|nr:winged helix-turn-helix transcriptional regulator [Acidobacteriota bacterium]
MKDLPNLYLQSPKLNQLNILREVAANANITQAELAGRCSLSVAMVNNYMKELCRTGLMEYHRKTIKSVTYHLTSAGTKHLETLQLELINEMVDMFVAAKAQIRARILSQSPSAMQRVVLFGCGHLAQLAFHALELTGASILGVCDDSIETIGSEFCGREVLNSSQIRFLSPDAVIVADTQRTEDICRNLRPLLSRGITLIRLDGSAEPKPAEGVTTDLPLEVSDNLESDRVPL